MRGRLPVFLVGMAVAAVAVYWFGIRQGTVDPRLAVPRLAAAIGEGEAAVGVTGGGAVVRWLPLPENPSLPRLPLDEPPEGGRLRGPALEQARVLAAAPDPLSPYAAASSYGERGVEVELTTGIELWFGDASRAARKWRAAAAVLADPSITGLDYVDVQAPNRPSFGGSGHELPPAP